MSARRSSARRSRQVPEQPSEEELRAAYEAELSASAATDMIAQAAVSLLNIGAYRMERPASRGR